MNFQKHHTQAHIKLGVDVLPHVSEMLSFQSYQNPEHPDLSVSQTSEHCCQGRPLLGDLSITVFYVWQEENILEVPKASWCDGWVMVRVFPMICHLFQVTLIKKTHLVWHLRKLKLLLIEHIKFICILENEHFPHKAQRIILPTELSCVISLEVLYLLLKVYGLSTNLPGNTTLTTPNIL